MMTGRTDLLRVKYFIYSFILTSFLPPFLCSDVHVAHPPEEVIVMYVSALKQVFSEMPPPHRRKVYYLFLSCVKHDTKHYVANKFISEHEKFEDASSNVQFVSARIALSFNNYLSSASVGDM